MGGLAFAAAAVVWSCGLDDSAVISLDQDASTSDGSTFDSSVEDSGGDGSEQGDTGTKDSGLDAGFDAGPCARGDLPTCDDGTCSSAADICAPPIPAGWHVTNLIAGSRRDCDPAYGGDAGGRDVVLLGDGGAAACSCDCEATGNPSCANVHVDIAVGVGSTCDVANDPLDMTANCAALGISIGGNSQATVSIASGSTCGGTTDASAPEIDGGLSRTCDFSVDAAAPICAGHRACVPKPTDGHVCIAHAVGDAGAVTCPSGFSYAFSSTVADSYSDSRTCSACTCGFEGIGCTNPVVSFYSGAGCSGTPTTVTQATCSNNGGGLSVGVSGTDAPSCLQTDGGAPLGGVTATNADVVCCSN